MDWDLSVDVDRFVNIDDFLSDSGYFDCLDNLSLDLKGDFLLDFDIFGYFYNFLHDSLRPRNWSRDLNNHFHWLLYNNFSNYLFWDDMFMPVNLCISIFEQLSHHIQLNFELVFFTL